MDQDKVGNCFIKRVTCQNFQKRENGDMKKGDGPNPGEELLYKLSLNETFKQDVITERCNLGIPACGFKNTTEKIGWIERMDIVDYFDALDGLRKKYKITVGYNKYLEEYLCYGNANYLIMKNERPEIATIASPTKREIDVFESEPEGYYQRRNEPYARVFIFGNGRKSDVIKFIDKNWDKVEEILKEQGWSRPKAMRQTIYKERNLRIKVLWRKPIKELRLLADKADPEKSHQTSKYKDLLIQVIIRKEFGRISDGYIRKIAAEK